MRNLLFALMVVASTGCDCGPAPQADAGAPDAGTPDAGSRCEDGGAALVGGGSGPTDAGSALVEYYQFCFECPAGIGLVDGGARRPGDGLVGASCTTGMSASVAPCRVFCCTCASDSTKHFWSQACVNGLCPDEATSCAVTLENAAVFGVSLCR